MKKANLGRVMGSRWYYGQSITGTSKTATIFPESGIANAYEQDMYLNENTSNVYECETPGDASTATWAYVCNLKGTVELVNEINSTSRTKALSAAMGNKLRTMIIDSGIYAKSVSIDVEEKIFIAKFVLENIDTILTFTLDNETEVKYSVEAEATGEQNTILITIDAGTGFPESGAIIKSIKSSDAVFYNIELQNGSSVVLYNNSMDFWGEVDELNNRMTWSGAVSDGEEILNTGILSKIKNTVSTILYPITHAKAVWFSKSSNETVYEHMTSVDEKIGSTDISKVGDGTVTGAIETIKNSIPTSNKDLTNDAGYITSAGSCKYASTAGSATSAASASSATSASYASTANYATSAGTANSASSASTASYANSAGSANSATTASSAWGDSPGDGEANGWLYVSARAGVSTFNTTYNYFTKVWGGEYTNQSSRLVKENIADISEEEGNKILNLNPVSFDYRENFGGEKGKFGLIAEDTLQVLPHCVIVPDNYDENKFNKSKGVIGNKILGISYPTLIPHIIKLCQNQQKQIDELTTKIESLEKT